MYFADISGATAYVYGFVADKAGGLWAAGFAQTSSNTNTLIERERTIIPGPYLPARPGGSAVICPK